MIFWWAFRLIWGRKPARLRAIEQLGRTRSRRAAGWLLSAVAREPRSGGAFFFEPFAQGSLDEQERAAARAALIEIGEVAMDLLVAAQTSPHVEARAIARDALLKGNPAWMKHPAVRAAVPGWAAALEDGALRFAKDGSRPHDLDRFLYDMFKLLGGVGDPSAIGVIRRIVDRTTIGDEAVNALAQLGDPEGRFAQAARFLSSLGRDEDLHEFHAAGKQLAHAEGGLVAVRALVSQIEGTVRGSSGPLEKILQHGASYLSTDAVRRIADVHPGETARGVWVSDGSEERAYIIERNAEVEPSGPMSRIERKTLRWESLRQLATAELKRREQAVADGAAN